MRSLIALAATAVLLMTASPALAGGYGHGYRHHGHHHGGHGYYLLGALLTGAVIGDLVARSSAPPPPRYVQAPQPQLGHCQATTGTGTLNGRPALFGGTICYDARGSAYVLNGSRHFLRYLR